jgi:hypothetical protein
MALDKLAARMETKNPDSAPGDGVDYGHMRG